MLRDTLDEIRSDGRMFCSGVAQLDLEQRPSKPWVEGSSPSLTAKRFKEG